MGNPKSFALAEIRRELQDQPDPTFVSLNRTDISFLLGVVDDLDAAIARAEKAEAERFKWEQRQCTMYGKCNAEAARAARAEAERDEAREERDHEADGHQLSVAAWNRDVLPLRAEHSALRTRLAALSARWRSQAQALGYAGDEAADELDEAITQDRVTTKG